MLGFKRKIGKKILQLKYFVVKENKKPTSGSAGGQVNNYF